MKGTFRFSLDDAPNADAGRDLKRKRARDRVGRDSTRKRSVVRESIRVGETEDKVPIDVKISPR